MTLAEKLAEEYCKTHDGDKYDAFLAGFSAALGEVLKLGFERIAGEYDGPNGMKMVPVVLIKASDVEKLRGEK